METLSKLTYQCRLYEMSENPQTGHKEHMEVWDTVERQLPDDRCPKGTLIATRTGESRDDVRAQMVEPRTKHGVRLVRIWGAYDF